MSFTKNKEKREKYEKKVGIVVLSILMAITILFTVPLPAASLTKSDVIPAGTLIFFDNTDTGWTNVYLYSWDFGFAGEFLQMKRVGNTDFYSYKLPEDVTVGSNFCLFVNQNSWAGAEQTRDIAYPSAAVNTVVPAVGTSPLDYAWAHSSIDLGPLVSATPSKTFIGTLDVVLNESCYSAKYSTDNRATYTAYKDGTVVTISETATFHLRGYDASGKLVASAAYTYTKVAPTTVTVSVTGYSGDIYVFIYGDDHIGADFYQMQQLPGGTYLIQFEGAALLDFFTSPSWDESIRLNSQPLFAAAGTTTHFEFTYPQP